LHAALPIFSAGSSWVTQMRVVQVGTSPQRAIGARPVVAGSSVVVVPVSSASVPTATPRRPWSWTQVGPLGSGAKAQLQLFMVFLKPRTWPSQTLWRRTAFVLTLRPPTSVAFIRAVIFLPRAAGSAPRGHPGSALPQTFQVIAWMVT